MEELWEVAANLGPLGTLIVILFFVWLKYGRKGNGNETKNTQTDNSELVSELNNRLYNVEQRTKDSLATTYSIKNRVDEMHGWLAEKDDDGTFRWWNKESLQNDVKDIKRKVDRINGT